MDLPQISKSIWNDKYRNKAKDPNIQATMQRVATALAETELDAHEYYNALKDFRFIPAGRILTNAGADRKTTMVNCFVMGKVEDDLDSIFKILGESARTMKYGGGIGVDFSNLRPNGSHVKGADSTSSGPLPFMDLWNSMGATIMSAGHRRGAQMGVMRVDHPDILDFIRAKLQKRLEMFNLSVLVTDNFMRAVKQDLQFKLKFQGKVVNELPANQIWDEILKCTYQVAEPGVIFIDRINYRNNLSYRETITCTNPCAEQPLPNHGSCVLGSVNLAALVENPFSVHARIHPNDLALMTNTGVRMLDRVIDVTKYPLQEQEIESKKTRRIGLGVTGLGDALAMLGVRYGSDESIEFIRDWMTIVRNEAYFASADLAVLKGRFPEYRAEILDSFNLKMLPSKLRDKIKQQGLRNGTLNSIAPTGTISLFAKNVSSGIEPIFAKKYTRKVMNGSGSKTDNVVVDYAVNLFEQLHPNKEHPDTLISTEDLDIDDHIKVQSTVQEYVDTSVSKTVNVPKDISYSDFKSVYQDAYNSGCKSISTYRPNEVRGSVLSEIESEAEMAKAENEAECERLLTEMEKMCKIDEHGQPSCS